MRQLRPLVIDLTNIKGPRDVRCPRCMIRISPDNRTRNAYRILEPVMEGDSLDRIVLQCNKCGSLIHLTSFNTLNLMR